MVLEMPLALTQTVPTFSATAIQAPNTDCENFSMPCVELLALPHHDLGHDHFPIAERSQSGCRSAKLQSNGISCAEAD
jgi:hypothetical protein